MALDSEGCAGKEVGKAGCGNDGREIVYKIVSIDDVLKLEPPQLNGCLLRLPAKAYVLEDCVAKTIFGAVWKAIDVTEDKRVALKVSSVAQTTLLPENPEAESEVMRSLQCMADDGHKNLIRSLGYFSKKSPKGTHTYCLSATEWSRHGDLYGFVAPGAGLKSTGAEKREGEVAGIVQGVLRGLEFMHQRGYAHLDVSLENILMFDSASPPPPRRDNGPAHTSPLSPKLCDFGLTVHVPSAPSLSGSATKKDEERRLATSTLGKELYMAPEIASGVAFSPKLADSYSIGIVAFILLTGHPPYEHPCRRKDARFRLIMDAKNGLHSLLRHYKKIDCLSNPAVKFLSSLICLEESRLSVADALNHEFITRSGAY